MINKKSIVLNGVDEKDKRAILTMVRDCESVNGTLRLYNYAVEPNGIMSLGICFDGQVIKAGLTQTEMMTFQFKSQIESIPQTFSCAVINFIDGLPKPILYGNSDGYLDEDDVFSQVIKSLYEVQNSDEVEQVLDAHGVDFDEGLKEEIQTEIDRCINSQACTNCDDCEYKKYYMRSISAVNSQSEEIEEKKTFYQDMKLQIESLFNENPPEEYLQKLIPNSKWVKVELDSQDYYVLGLISENEKIVYICYGVPGVFQKNPPRELAGYPIWFPLDENNLQGFGYWLSYQDAETGESVKAVVV